MEAIALAVGQSATEHAQLPHSLKLEGKGLHFPVRSVCKVHGHLDFTVCYAGAVLISLTLSLCRLRTVVCCSKCNVERRSTRKLL